MRSNIDGVRPSRLGRRAKLDATELEQATPGSRRGARSSVRGLDEIYPPATAFESLDDFVHVRITRLPFTRRLEAEIDEPVLGGEVSAILRRVVRNSLNHVQLRACSSTARLSSSTIAATSTSLMPGEKGRASVCAATRSATG